MRTARIACAVLVGIAACQAASAAALPPQDRPWFVVRSPNFIVYAESDEGVGREASQRLESFRAVAGHVAKWLRPRDSKPTAVFAFRDETSFAPYRLAITGDSSKECLGFFLGGADLNYVGLKAGGPLGSNVVYHELIHDLASRNFAYLPAWLSEGMADYWSTYWSDGKIAEVGRAHEPHLRGPLEKAPPVPVGVLFRDKRTPQAHRGGIPELEFYASSWLLVHYLTNAGEATSSRFFRYVEALRAGEAEWRAHKEAFGFDFGSLDAAVAKYRFDGNFRTVRVPIESIAVPTGDAALPASRQEVLRELGDLLAASGPRNASAAEAHVEAALALAPDDPSSLAARGFLRFQQDRIDEAVTLLERAIGAGASDARTLFRTARAVLARTSGKPPSGEIAPAVQGARRAAELIRRGLEKEPENAEALADLGRAVLAESSEPQPGIAALEKAWDFLPSRQDIGWNLVQLLLRKGERARAVALVEGRLGNLLDRLMTSRARRSVADADLVEAHRLAEAGKYDEALARGEAAVRIVDDARDREEIQAELRRLTEWTDDARDVQAYNAAAAMVGRGDRRGAMRALEALVASCKSPRVCAQAKAELERMK